MDCTNFVRVRLTKRRRDGFGFEVKGRPTAPRMVICDLLRGGEAERSGLVRPGDFLVRVDSTDLSKLKYDEAIEVLRSIPVETAADLVLKAPPGQRVRLETTFSEDGTPRTVRVSEPCKAGDGTPNNSLRPLHGLAARRWSTPRLPSPERPKSLSPETPRPPTNRSCKLRNLMTGVVNIDTLCKNASENVQCNEKVCLGSLMSLAQRRAPGSVRSKDELIDHAKKFYDEYYSSSKRLNSLAHQQRWSEVSEQIEETGSYELKETELIYGAKLAWRNAVRCVGRIQWTKLQVFDCRYVDTALGMYQAICNHIKYATNKGNLRSTITMFPHRKDGVHDFRVWNPQLIGYAGYREPDGTIIGDPTQVEFTEVCVKAGWKPKRLKWEILPLCLQALGKDPEIYDIPDDIIMRVKIQHPKYKIFEELDLQWYVLPAVSNMMLDCGGLEFTGCPFNGWYMVTEVGSRDLCDPQRFNITEAVAEGMGLDISNQASLWKDQAIVETNVAVLYSFQKNNVAMVDHHTLAESFKRHWETEQRVRGGCPADWVWHIPPTSGNLMWIFHQEMAYYHLKPSYEYQEAAWKSHVWEKEKENGGKPSPRKLKFKEIVRAVKFTSNLFGKALSRRIKATILYATETGHSRDFAALLENIFSYAFNVQVTCMNDYNISDLEHESLILVVTSTFGNGDPPENGEAFARAIQAIKVTGETTPDVSHMSVSTSFTRMNSMGSDNERKLSYKLVKSSSATTEATIGPMSSIRYGVFSLGSSAYPNFCAFGRYVDTLLEELGGEKIYDMGTGDELCGQEHSFRQWAANVFQAAMDVFCISDDVNISQMKESLKGGMDWSPDKARVVKVDKKTDLYQELAKISHRNVKPCKLIRKTSLHPEEDGRLTMLFEFELGKSDFRFVPGDHLAVYPSNRPALVQDILDRLEESCPDPDAVLEVQLKTIKQTIEGPKATWKSIEKLPALSLRVALTSYLDITTPPSQKLLSLFVRYATDSKDKTRLTLLSTQMKVYEEWKAHEYPTLFDVLEEFPSLCLDAAFILANMPPLQARFYSISSSPEAFPGEIHATIAIVTFHTKGGEGPLHYGVCSNFLASLPEGESAPCFIRSDPSFSLPGNVALPIIMVGPGTGIAPFRGFWQQRMVDIRLKNLAESQFGAMTLFFGCRTSTVELYRHETQLMMESGILSKYYAAFSREPHKKKYYVQDIMWEQASNAIYQQIVVQGGHFYVCGDVTMADCVTKTLREILQKHGSMSPIDAEKYVFGMKEQNRFHDDIFGITLRTAEQTRRVRIEAQQKHQLENTLLNGDDCDTNNQLKII